MSEDILKRDTSLKQDNYKLYMIRRKYRFPQSSSALYFPPLQKLDNGKSTIIYF